MDQLMTFYLILAIIGLAIAIVALPTMIHGPKNHQKNKFAKNRDRGN